ncbi:hypothetical protein [Pseudomonas sp. FFUP_PS_473]|uniref:hypothetical protein n=1 Tax=Pseudomonas sp. FFUP_PS_473 TaxID=2060418 RepID=UPI0011AE664D|nr:hypothetical protein [Pseudomonas sp. FFUP_PS_473]
MSPTKPDQELHAELEGSASIMEWAAFELIEIAKRINNAGLPDEAMELMGISKELRIEQEVLYSCADDVLDGLICRKEL